MIGLLKVYIEQLRDEKKHFIKEILAPDFLEIQEADLVFDHPIYVDGDVSIVGEVLMVQLSVHTEAQMPCTICNQRTYIHLEARNIYHAIELNTIKTSIFNLTPLVREEILLLVPQFIECNGQECPERKILMNYMKGKSTPPNKYLPFADL